MVCLPVKLNNQAARGMTASPQDLGRIKQTPSTQARQVYSARQTNGQERGWSEADAGGRLAV